MKFLQKLYRQTKRWIQHLSRVEKSAILTLLSLFFILLLLTIIQLRNGTSEEFIEIIPANEDFVDIEQIKEQERQEKWKDFLDNAKATTKSYNEADKKLLHTDEHFKTLDELLEERKEQQSSEDEVNENFKGDFKIPEKRKKEKKSSEKPNESKVNKNSYVRYSLEGRKPISPLPNPIYTCDASGKIVLNITVNSDGIVVSLNFNSQESTSDNGCLIENALSYARKAQFNLDNRRRQSGTITYYFQGR